MSAKEEFPDFDYEIQPLIDELNVDAPEGHWTDNSWHNVVMPCASNGFDNLWFDYNNPTLSEYPDDRALGNCKKFTLVDCNDVELCATDDWPAMREFIKYHLIQE